MLREKRICLLLTLTAWTHISIRAIPLSFCVTPSVKQLALVQESLPVVHRLRLSASA